MSDEEAIKFILAYVSKRFRYPVKRIGGKDRQAEVVWSKAVVSTMSLIFTGATYETISDIAGLNRCTMHHYNKMVRDFIETDTYAKYSVLGMISEIRHTLHLNELNASFVLKIARKDLREDVAFNPVSHLYYKGDKVYVPVVMVKARRVLGEIVYCYPDDGMCIPTTIRGTGFDEYYQVLVQGTLRIYPRQLIRTPTRRIRQ
ncbi:MAG: hypothetical protein WC961_07210 [Anaerovoracaceae bacterium]|jgi:hypothetical protein